MTAKIEIETTAAEHARENTDLARRAWIKPAYQKFPVRGAEAGDSNSNFDGSSFSS